MRPLEILLSILVMLSSAALLWRASRALRLSLSLLSLTALLIHAFWEGPHWQMGPAYLAVLLLFGSVSINRNWMRWTVGCLTILLVGASCVASALLPMFHLPAPSGPYAIGTQMLYLVDEHPLDPASATSGGKRELMVQVWYPAALSHNRRAPYRILPETTLKSSFQAVLWTHSRWNAPIASGGPFPVLLLNPAWSGRRTYYLYLVEELASHGYVVAGIDHTGNSGPTAFPDGHVTQPTYDPGMDFDTHTFEQLNAFAARELAVEVDDNRFVLDQLQRMNADPGNIFFDRLDLNRVGALGHSFGGAVAAQLCLNDPRVKSALDMDGSYWGPVQKVGLSKPIMMIEEDQGRFTPEQLAHDRVALNDHLLDLGDMEMMHKSNGYLITLHGSTHSSFSDRSLYSPRKSWSGEGAIPADREYAILRRYTLAFFDKTLRGENPEILQQDVRPYPETSIEWLHRPEQ